jgi:hypothetical protein
LKPIAGNFVWDAVLKGRGLQPCPFKDYKSHHSNHMSEENKFRKRFPKEMRAVHRGFAGTITFALQQTLPKADQRKNLIGDH